MPYTTFADGSVLTASQVNTNFRDQVISTVTSGTRPSGTEGQMIYETDTDRFYVYNGGWTEWGGLGAWVSYTPTVTQSAAVTKTVTYARYIKMGRLVIAEADLSMTGAGSANNSITVSLPATAAQASDLPCGNGIVYDSSAVVLYPGIPCIITTTTIHFFDTSQAVSPAATLGQTGTAMSAALASGDVIRFHIVYEASA